MDNKQKKLYIETYGCQMNVADSELVVSILNKEDYEVTKVMKEADVILVNTCSIRDNAEQRVYGRLAEFKQIKKARPDVLIGVLGCMAERLKEKLVEQEKMVDIVAGPDSYRNLPELIQTAEDGRKAINVLLSREETYADICPVRYASNGVSAFVSIMRGCDNMCAYCVVPFTRGRERSRKPETILKEIKELVDNNYKEVTLLGQNVDKYNFEDTETGKSVSFAQLLKLVAEFAPNMRIRFATSYPQDMTDEVLHTMAAHKNICKYIHLPIQSGSTAVLTKMKRNYTRKEYLQRIEAIKRIVPDCGISSDFIAGFCGETEDDHQETLSVMKEVKFDFSYMFKYSERPNTFAARKFEDDIPEEVKTRRLTEIINLQNQLSLESNQNDIGKTFEVLVEGVSKKSPDKLFGRNSQNKVVVFPKENFKKGDFAMVKIEECSSATLKGIVV